MRILPAILLIFGVLFQYADPSPEECPPFFVCGKLGELQFPYINTTQNDECGPFVVKGCDKLDRPQVQFERGKGKWFEVNEISLGGSISIIDTDFKELLGRNSCESFTNLSFPILPFAYPFQIIPNLTIFKCPPNVTVDPSLTKLYQNHTGCSPNFTIYYPPPLKHLPSLPGCTILQLPLNTNTINHANIFQLLTPKFSILALVEGSCYYCHLRGKCDGEFPHCASNNPRAYAERRKNKRVIIPIVTAASFAGIVLISVYFVINFCWSKTGKDAEMIEVALRNQHSLAPRRYRYSEVKRITRAFREKLGKGGYGSVFKGELPNGRLVAVKVLKDSKSNGEDFVNEVSSISRTSHVNIVTLLGFCFEGSMRALIYEFMPNGSLDKYIYDENTKEDHRLRTETLYQITVGIAQGLEYLHRGCNTRILHFDIKPHNILLDENFCPKISDFGLAKVCIRNDSIVSLMGARGTVGYIAPEVFCRNIGGVSHKSDVYSYGMMVLEMVGGRKNVCVEVDRSSEIYFPHWIYNRIELGEELGLLGLSNDEEKQLARKMIVVSLWCIQTNPLNRPPMCRVVEMLQGSLESLPIPPKPYLSSPSSSPVNAFGVSSSSAGAKFSGDQLLVS